MSKNTVVFKQETTEDEAVTWNLAQQREVFEPMKRSSRTGLLVFFAVLLVVLSVLAVIFSKAYLLLIFLPVLAVLIVSGAVAAKKDRERISPEPHEHPEAIFKEHEV